MSDRIRNHYLNTICPSIWINGRGKSERKIASMRNLEEFDNWFNMLSIEAKNCRWDIKNVPFDRSQSEDSTYYREVLFNNDKGKLNIVLKSNIALTCYVVFRCIYV